MQILQILLDGGIMILSEMPDKFNWRKMLPHLTKMCNSHGLKQKNVVGSGLGMEFVSWNCTEDEHPVYKESSLAMANAFKLALKGEQKFKAFYLYRYNEKTGYLLLRKPI